jgi:GTP 3',8-cyclase
MLAGIDGIADIALTTNGSALAARATRLKGAALTRVTVSLDALYDHTFAAMNDVGFPVSRVLAGMDAAADAGRTGGQDLITAGSASASSKRVSVQPI